MKNTQIILLPNILIKCTFQGMAEKFGSLKCTLFCALFSFSAVGEALIYKL